MKQVRIVGLEAAVEKDVNSGGLIRRENLISRPWLPLLIFGFSLFYLFLSYPYGLRIGDEGYLVAGVTRILDGQIPYIDNQQNYSPGQFYLFAIFFKLFGLNLLLIRKFWVILNAVSAVLAFLLARRMVPLRMAFLPSVLVTIMPSPMHKSFFVFIPLLNLYLTALYLEKRIAPVWFGLVVGLTILFRQDAGFAGVIVGLAAILLYDIEKTEHREKEPFHPSRISNIISGWSHFSIGVICALLPLLLYFWAHSGLRELVTQLLFSGLRANKAKALPFPDIHIIVQNLLHGESFYLLVIYYMPFVIYAGSLCLIIKNIVERKTGTPPVFHSMVFLTGIMVFFQAMARSDKAHMLQVLPPFYLLLTYWIFRSWAWARDKSASLLKRIPGLALFFILMGSAVYLNIFHLFLSYNQKSPFFTIFSKQYTYRTLDSPRAKVRLLESDYETVSAVVKYIMDHSSDQDYLLCMPYASIFNFIAGRRNPTRYEVFRRGEMDGSQKQQQEIIRSLENPRLKYIVLDDRTPDGIQSQRMEYYMPEVYEFILKNFQPVKRISPYLILARIGSVQ